MGAIDSAIPHGKIPHVHPGPLWLEEIIYPRLRRRMKKGSAKSEMSQSARFIEAAKKTGADESGKPFEKAFKKIVRADKPKAPKS
jgi:hypothetical protein